MRAPDTLVVPWKDEKLSATAGAAAADVTIAASSFRHHYFRTEPVPRESPEDRYFRYPIHSCNESLIALHGYLILFSFFYSDTPCSRNNFLGDSGANRESIYSSVFDVNLHIRTQIYFLFVTKIFHFYNNAVKNVSLLLVTIFACSLIVHAVAQNDNSNVKCEHAVGNVTALTRRWFLYYVYVDALPQKTSNVNRIVITAGRRVSLVGWVRTVEQHAME